jgi:hypothetical protein
MTQCYLLIDSSYQQATAVPRTLALSADHVLAPLSLSLRCQSLQVFCTGTAAVVSPVRAISYQGEDLLCRGCNDDIGDFAERVWNALTDIQYGRTPHAWSVKVNPERLKTDSSE